MKFYLDTSIFGGFFDKEFEKPTHKLFDFIEEQSIKIIYSSILEKELEVAPEHVKLKASNILLKAEYIEVITKETPMFVKAKHKRE